MVNGNIVRTGDLLSAGPLLNQRDTRYRQYGVTTMHINRIRYQTLLAPSEIKGTVPKYFQLLLYTWPLSSLVLLFSSCDCLYVPCDLCELNTVFKL